MARELLSSLYDLSVTDKPASGAPRRTPMTAEMDMKPSTAIKRVSHAVLAALGIAVLGTGAAWAVPVTSWNFDLTTTFENAVFTSGTGSTINTPTKLAWGNRDPQSSLELDPNVNPSGTVFTDGPLVDAGIIMTHNNFVIPLNSKILDTADLANTIILTANTPPGSPRSPFSLDFGIHFDETPNTAPCVVSSSATPCDDIFVISHESLNHSFTYDGYTYFLNYFPESVDGGINFLDPDVCAAAGASAGCFGFTTEENSSNPLRFGLTITSSPVRIVPEPGILGMMGLGLLGIVGLAIHRRKSSVR